MLAVSISQDFRLISEHIVCHHVTVMGGGGMCGGDGDMSDGDMCGGDMCRGDGTCGDMSDGDGHGHTSQISYLSPLPVRSADECPRNGLGTIM